MMNAENVSEDVLLLLKFDAYPLSMLNVLRSGLDSDLQCMKDDLSGGA